MKMFRHLSSVFAIATIAPLALAATLAATPAIAQADQLSNPDWLALLSDYEKNYWQAPADAEHGGKVLDADTMKLDEDLAVAINHKAAENLDKDGLNAQRKRALVDSDLQAEETDAGRARSGAWQIYERRAQIRETQCRRRYLLL